MDEFGIIANHTNKPPNTIEIIGRRKFHNGLYLGGVGTHTRIRNHMPKIIQREYIEFTVFDSHGGWKTSWVSQKCSIDAHELFRGCSMRVQCQRGSAHQKVAAAECASSCAALRGLVLRLTRTTSTCRPVQLFTNCHNERHSFCTASGY